MIELLNWYIGLLSSYSPPISPCRGKQMWILREYVRECERTLLIEVTYYDELRLKTRYSACTYKRNVQLWTVR
jgi:hypothetical protein